MYFGESLEAAVAIAVAAEDPPDALILGSPFTSLADVGRVHYPWLPINPVGAFDGERGRGLHYAEHEWLIFDRAWLRATWPVTKMNGRSALSVNVDIGLPTPFCRLAVSMFVQYYGEVTRPFDEVVDRCPMVLVQIEGWAQASYRDGEAIRAKMGPRGEGSFVAKTVRLEIGDLVESTDARRIPLTWEATGTPGLFPKMDAELVIARVGDDLTQVKIQGHYDPPLGSLGRLIDRAFLHRIAEASTKELVDQIVEELSAADGDG